MKKKKVMLLLALSLAVSSTPTMIRATENGGNTSLEISSPENEIATVHSEADLVAAVEKGGTVVVANNITLAEPITIVNNVIIKAEQEVTITTKDVVDAFIVKAEAKLTLGANIKVDSNDSILYANGGIINIDGAVLTTTSEKRHNLAFIDEKGTINVISGDVKQTGDMTTISVGNGKLNITGGNVSSEGSSAIVVKTANSVLNMTDGTVSTTGANSDGEGYVAIYNAQGGKIEISGGKVSSKYGAAVDAEDGTVEISGGTFLGAKGFSVTKNATTGTMSITGGTFSDDAAKAFLSDGYVLISGTDGAYTVQKKAEIDVKHNVTLESIIDFSFFIDTTELESMKGLTATITHDHARKDKDGKELDDVVCNNVKYELVTDNGTTYYRFRYEGVAAAEMVDDIKLVIKNDKGEVIVEDTSSVQEYALAQIESDSSSEELKTLLKEFLEYGASAQKFFDYKEDTLADANLQK